ncbi:chromatin-remodeling ATPase INO80-like [Pyrgilauda ruficollis]|uniref:chromatin-remodeling ATPase INO80-like n=1 Tax=Pyrgilauda ruficollis TaxID=221976 RepID=UPI001B869836|nr:chromatin-remodeling ATPase INO80-like [Pyrgilauda ruficollis]
MASFLKTILEPSEEDAFDHLTWMEKPSVISISGGLSSEDELPSPNVGLPSALIPRQPPGPAYVTHTGPLVRRLRQQDGLGAAAPDPLPTPEPALHPLHSEPRPRSELSTSPTPEHPPGAPEDAQTSALPGVCHMVIFARKPPSSTLPPSSPCSSHGE